MKTAATNKVCSQCGREFSFVSRQADSLSVENWKEWARSNKLYCRFCYAKLMQKRIEDAGRAFVKLNSLPVIQASTEKQLAYAESVRARFIGAHLSHCRAALELLRSVDIEKIQELSRAECHESEPSAEASKVIENSFREAGLFQEYCAISQSDAKTIIAALAPGGYYARD